MLPGSTVGYPSDPSEAGLLLLLVLCCFYGRIKARSNLTLMGRYDCSFILSQAFEFQNLQRHKGATKGVRKPWPPTSGFLFIALGSFFASRLYAKASTQLNSLLCTGFLQVFYS